MVHRVVKLYKVCGEKLTMYCQEYKKQKNKNKSEDRERRKRKRKRERAVGCFGGKQKSKNKSEKVEDKEGSGYTCVEEKKKKGEKKMKKECMD